MRRPTLILLVPALLVATLAVSTADAAAQQAPNASRSLVVYCPHPQDFVNPIVQEFEVETGIRVQVVAAGTGELLERVVAERNDPRGDVVWGGSRASLETYKAYFAPYESRNRSAFIARYVEPGNYYTPFTAIPTVLMYNSNLVSPAEYPRSWADLLDPKWRGRIAFADPALSSSSFEALVNMLFAMGGGNPQAGWDYVGKFVANLGGTLLGGSTAVYKGVAEGFYAVGVTFEEAAVIYRRQGAPVGVSYPAEGTVVEPDGVAVIKGAKNPQNARLFVDFVTSKKVQMKIARDLNRRSCRVDVAPAAGLLSTASMHVIPGDFVWASANRDQIIARFKSLLGH
ncbi:MAG TPA: ABC transporter substrate-binding protein [Rectinemataceae bacterium]|nr:ABC transporter substrate-binding protein [Rectinemataceae bacterium]